MNTACCRMCGVLIYATKPLKSRKQGLLFSYYAVEHDLLSHTYLLIGVG